jgi:hypothetical protein
MFRCLALSAVICLTAAAAADDKAAKPLTPEDAIKRVGDKVTVEMEVRASKNALAKHKEIYLDSQKDFRDPKNLAVVIPESAVAKFKDAGVEDPAAHYKDHTLRVTGTVTLFNERPRIVVEDPKQIIDLTRKK